jgi:hypothetical protein
MPAYKGTKKIRVGKAPPTPAQSKAALDDALDAVKRRREMGITSATVDFRPTPMKRGR